MRISPGVRVLLVFVAVAGNAFASLMARDTGTRIGYGFSSLMFLIHAIMKLKELKGTRPPTRHPSAPEE